MRGQLADFAHFVVLLGLFSGTPIVVHAADLNGPNLDLSTESPSYLAAPDELQDQDPSPIADFFAHWSDRVDQARATQPHWETPLATSTPRLTQEVVGNILLERLGNGADLYNFGGGKGLDLIPTVTNQISFYTPPYEVRTEPDAAHGIGDWPFFLIKQLCLPVGPRRVRDFCRGFATGGNCRSARCDCHPVD